jgi:16S rRNA (adenine1518-N6/adenine1519-N6)-dimethyltransferase
MYAKKSLGQHFLKSKAALRSIVEASRLSAEDTVLEIGPGKGALTEVLLPHVKKIIAIEKDALLAAALETKYSAEISAGKLKIIVADILELDDTTLAAEGITAGNYKLIANIPYYITGAIIRKFLSESIQPSLMCLLVQKEVIEH